MRPEIENIINDLQLYFPGEDHHLDRQRIEEMIERAEIKYQYQEEMAKRPYGQGETIKHELAERYNKSYKTIKRIIY
jgi:hypothetical protein